MSRCAYIDKKSATLYTKQTEIIIYLKYIFIMKTVFQWGRDISLKYYGLGVFQLKTAKSKEEVIYIDYCGNHSRNYLIQKELLFDYIINKNGS